MDRHVELLDEMYSVIIRRARAMRPFHQVFHVDKWRDHFVKGGMAADVASEFTLEIGQQLEEAFLDTWKSPARAAAVNLVFCRNGLPQDRLQPVQIVGACSRLKASAIDPARPRLAPPGTPNRTVDRALAAVEGRGVHLVYKLYDKQARLLYVGITSRGPVRLSEHYRSKPWFPEVARVEFERFETREICAARETFLIKALHPQHNIQHNGAVHGAA